MADRYRLAYLVSHPIQYQAPMLRTVAADPEIDLTVYFLSDFSVRQYRDPGFATTVAWDVPLLEGYRYEFLPAWAGAERVTPLQPLSRGLWRRLRAGRFDALWLHGYSHPVHLRALLIARMLRMPVFVRSDAQLGSAARTPTSRRIKDQVVRALYRRIDAFLAVGELNRRYYRHYGAPTERIFMTPYAVDNAFFQTRAAAASLERDGLRAELGLDPDRPVILYASKFVARKRAGDLLEAYIRLSSDGVREPRPYLLFVGDGEERAILETRARLTGWRSIRFLGFKNQSELARYFDLCDVFALVSEREPYGLIVNEVMNAGRPVIVSDQVGAGPDLVQDGANGYIVPVGDVDALRDRLNTLVTHPDLVRRMGQRSLEIIGAWDFQADLIGLKQALRATVARRLEAD